MPLLPLGLEADVVEQLIELGWVSAVLRWVDDTGVIYNFKFRLLHYALDGQLWS